MGLPLCLLAPASQIDFGGTLHDVLACTHARSGGWDDPWRVGLARDLWRGCEPLCMRAPASQFFHWGTFHGVLARTHACQEGVG